jgi:hypothetical protein
MAPPTTHIHRANQINCELCSLSCLILSLPPWTGQYVRGHKLDSCTSSNKSLESVAYTAISKRLHLSRHALSPVVPRKTLSLEGAKRGRERDRKRKEVVSVTAFTTYQTGAETQRFRHFGYHGDFSYALSYALSCPIRPRRTASD